MAAGRLSAHDRKDLERFTKFLIYKSLQIIVQSRLGGKIKTQSKCVSSGADWFNIAIKDLPDVQTEAKKLLSNQAFGVGQTICMEISLTTSDGDTMILEVWSLSMSDQVDSSMRTPHTAYYRMGVALKSIFSVSRVMPGYKLSRQQTPDNYIVCYKMYLGEPKSYLLGDGYKTAKVASVPMATGTVHIQALYRTKLAISPQHCSRRIELKTDHFLTDNSVTSSSKRQAKPCNSEFYRDVIKTSAFDDLDCQFPPFPVDHRDLDHDRLNHNYMNGDSPVNGEGPSTNGGTPLHHVTSQPIAINRQHPYESRPDDFLPHSTPDDAPSPLIHRKISAFAVQHTLQDYSMDLDDVPFESLLHPRRDSAVDIPNINGTLHNSDTVHKTTTESPSDDLTLSPSSTKSSAHRQIQSTMADEDFVMLELKTPFANIDSGSELNQFYRECQMAPSLTMFNNIQPDVDHELDTITQQLHLFETSVKDFDNFVSSLQDSQ